MESPSGPFFMSEFASSLEFFSSAPTKSTITTFTNAPEAERYTFCHLQSASQYAAFGVDQRLASQTEEAESAYVASFLKDEALSLSDQPPVVGAAGTTPNKQQIVDLAEDDSEGLCSTHESNSSGTTLTKAELSGAQSCKLFPHASPFTWVPSNSSLGGSSSALSPSVIKVNCVADLSIEVQPPSEIRTKTPREVRNFTVVVNASGRPASAYTPMLVRAELYYAAPDAHTQPLPVPGGDRILGGTTIVNVQSNGSAVFNNLSVSEASTKHEERDFCIGLTLIGGEPMQILSRKFTTSFYTYSHRKVLEKRRNITLKALSCANGSTEGSTAMHVIGSPFVKGPFFSVIFMTGYGSVRVSAVDLYSDCVAFFQLPPCPGGPYPPGTEVPALVCVTNDGKNFSEPLEFVYVARGEPSSKKRGAHYSRM